MKPRQTRLIVVDPLKSRKNSFIEVLSKPDQVVEATTSTKPSSRSLDSVAAVSWKQSCKNNENSLTLKPTMRSQENNHSHRSNQSSGRLSQRLLMFSAMQDRECSLTNVNMDNYPASNIFSPNLWEAQNTCMQASSIRKAFLEFLKNMRWLELLNPRIMELISKKLPMNEVKDHITFYDYIIAPRHRTASNDPRDRDEISMKMKKCTQLKVRDSMDVSGSTFRRNEKINTCFSDEQLRYFLLATVWPLFQQSVEYQSATSPLYQHSPVERISSNSFSELLTSSSDLGAALSRSNSNMKALDVEKLRRFKDIFYNTAIQLNAEEAESILIEGKWVEKLLDCIEHAPFSISVSSVGIFQSGYPLIFVNKMFESITQYQRTEALGRSCKILQGGKTDRDYCEKIASTLAKGSGIKLAMNNQRKDGSDFYNFLALRAVHDREGKYKFVLGVQYDMGKEDATLREIKLIEDLLILTGLVMKS